MQGETVQWDLRSMTVRSSGLSQIFVLYVVAAFFIGCWKIARVWRILVQQLSGDQSGYIQELEKVTNSINKWTQLTFLLWGFYVCFLTARTCLDWMPLSSHHISAWPSALHEMAAFTAAMLFTMTLLFLGQWYVEKRANFLSSAPRNQS